MDGARSSDCVEALLRDCRIIVVVGLSSNPARPSYQVAAYMQQQGKVIIPVNPHETRVLGEVAYPSLSRARPNRSGEHLSAV